MILKPTSHAGLLLANLLLLTTALSSGAIAQTQTQAGSPPATMMKSPGPGGRNAMAETDRVEQHIARLHAQLHITPAQQQQWDQFAQVMRDNAKSMDQAFEQRASNFGSMNAVDNMQSYAQIAQQHAEDTQKLATAFQSLYGSLSDAQKKNADAVFRSHDERRPPTRG
jgi:periplasmic protein CpxP/Spy